MKQGDPPVHKTLFAAKVTDLSGRKRSLRKAEATSDVTRFRGVFLAAAVGAVVALIAALTLSDRGALSSPGPLSRPHDRAGLTCASCHSGEPKASAADAGDSVSTSALAAEACKGCHGPHRSVRAGHARLAQSGAMNCVTCHPIHRGDQGVSFAPDAPPVRFAPGVTSELAAGLFRPAAEVTVALVTAGRCNGCHDVSAPGDPIARCLLPSQEGLGGARLIACFDEHQEALPVGLIGPQKRYEGVCSNQHTTDRALAWEAARQAAVTSPILLSGSQRKSPALWIALGLLGAALTLTAGRARGAFLARRRDKGKPSEAAALVKPAERVRLPTVDTNRCLGCYACVDACPYDVLEIQRYVAVVARPNACCGLTLCEQRCPNGSLVITDGAPIVDVPRLGDDLQSLDQEGLFLAGDVTGLPLIKNAIVQGEHAMTQVAKYLREKGAKGRDLDVIIVGAGPAGISASLKAKELGLRYETIEQGSVAQSIQSFPRGKLVFDQPIELPLSGKLWLKESTKEELLMHWLRIVRKEKLAIVEDTRMTDLVKAADASFVVSTKPREGGQTRERRARAVLLALGQRGTPRRLPFPLSEEALPRVHYHLADAKSFEGERVVVVGLGDVAMEAAIALGRQAGTTVTVVYRGQGFQRGKTRNIEELKALVDSGRVTLRFGTEVVALSEDRATLRSEEGETEIGYDRVLVLIGSIPPRETLRRAGVRTATAEEA